jgi:hypothetical protein
MLIDLFDQVEPDGAIDAAVGNLSEVASAYLEEVERAAAMQTRAGDRAVARRRQTRSGVRGTLRAERKIRSSFGVMTTTPD